MLIGLNKTISERYRITSVESVEVQNTADLQISAKEKNKYESTENSVNKIWNFVEHDST